MRRQARHALVAAAAWACAVALLALALSAGTSPRPASAAPVALSAFWPGDDYSTDLQDDQQVAPLEDPSMPSGEGEYIAMGDGEDDDAIQTGGDNPAMQHVATGRVFDVQRQGALDPEHTKHRNYEFPVF